MVLAELGGKLRDSLRKFHSTAAAGTTGRRAGVTAAELNSLLGEITRALIEADVNVKLVMSLRDNVKKKVEHLLSDDDDDDENNDDEDAKRKKQQQQASTLSKLVQRAVVDELVALLSPGGGSNSDASSSTSSSSGNNKKTSSSYQMRRGKSNVVLFVGLQGAGKTTTIGKFANYYQRRGWKCCMVCADTFRAGAFDQLKQNATKLRVPFYGSYTVSDPVQIAQDGVRQFTKDKYEVIIVDTSGRHKQESALFEEMQEISASIRPDQTILVMDATQGQAVYDQAAAFHAAVPVGAVIVTKLDGHAKGGGALSAVAATQSPILFLGSGEHFDDLDPFQARSFVSKMLGFGDVRGLMEAMKSVNDAKSQEELMDKMSKGQFTLRDMYNQFQKVMNMGPLNKLMGMMPGMPEYLIPKGGDQEATGRLRKFMVMMDSMNDAELDGKVDMHTKNDPAVESRIRRIAAGSGTHPNEVKMLLLTHRQMEGMVSKMGKSGLMGKNAQARQAQLVAQMRKNPNLIQQRLNQMDPRVLQQMGGRDHVMSMMQQMAKGGAGGGAGAGMPDMEALMGGGAGGAGGMMMPPGMMGGGGMPPGMMGGGGGMPGGAGAGAAGMPPGMGGMNMETMMKMAQAMGMGGGGMPPMGGGGMGGMPPPASGGRR